MTRKRLNGEGTISRLPSGYWRGQLTIGGNWLSITARNQRNVVDWIRETSNQVEDEPVSTIVDKPDVLDQATINKSDGVIIGAHVESQGLELLTAAEVAQLLKIDQSTVYRMMRAGEIATVKLGRSVRIRKIDLKRHIEDHLTG